MGRWPGTLLDASVPHGRSDCQIEVRDGSLAAVLPDGRELELPIETLELLRQGARGDLFAFQTAARPSRGSPRASGASSTRCGAATAREARE